MSEDIFADDKVLLTSFYGGVARGQCVQLTALDFDAGYVQLTRDEVKALALALQRWLKKYNGRKQK